MRTAICSVRTCPEPASTVPTHVLRRGHRTHAWGRRAGAERYSPAYMRKTWVGYPVQSNLWRLPQEEVTEIIQDLAIKSEHKPHPNYTHAPRHFGEWLEVRSTPMPPRLRRRAPAVLALTATISPDLPRRASARRSPSRSWRLTTPRRARRTPPRRPWPPPPLAPPLAPPSPPPAPPPSPPHHCRRHHGVLRDPPPPLLAHPRPFLFCTDRCGRTRPTR